MVLRDASASKKTITSYLMTLFAKRNLGWINNSITNNFGHKYKMKCSMPPCGQKYSYNKCLKFKAFERS